MFSFGEFVGFIRGNVLTKFKVKGLVFADANTPVDVNVTAAPNEQVSLTGDTPAGNDYSLIGNSIYGVSGLSGSSTTITKVNLNDNTVSAKAFTVSGHNASNALSNAWGATWQDINGNFYVFNNGSGEIFRVDNIESSFNNGPQNLYKVFSSAPSGNNDGFGCELMSDVFDFDGDGLSDAIDLDDDNDGILDVNEGFNGYAPDGDHDGDGILNYLDTNIPGGFVDANNDGVNDNFDTDKDGYPDAYDLDSDNDGCFDAIEGGDYVEQGHLNSDGSINTASYGGVDAQGVPNLVNVGGAANIDGAQGQSVGDAKDANKNSQCIPICTEPIDGAKFRWSYTNAGNGTIKETDMNDQPSANYGFNLDIYELDNSFNMTINGVKLALQELQFQSNGTTGINVEFQDGDQYEVNTGLIYEMRGDAPHPMIRIMISPAGLVTLYGSKTSYGPLFPLKLKNGNSFNTINWNVASNNTVKVSQLVNGTTIMDGYGYGNTIVPCPCFNPAFTGGTTKDTKVGVSLLKRAGASGDNWPMVRKGGHIALESNNQGFVLTRMTKVQIEGQTTPSEILPSIANPQEGMMVFDTTDKCLKIYSDGAWRCFERQACP